MTSIEKYLGDDESADPTGALAEFLQAINEAVGGTVTTVKADSTVEPNDDKYTSRSAEVIVHTLLFSGPKGLVTQELIIRLGEKDFKLDVTRPVGTGNRTMRVAPIICSESLSSR